MNAVNSGPPLRPFLPPPPPMVLEPIPAWKWVGSFFLLLAFFAGSVVLVKWSRARSLKARAAVISLHQKMTRADDAGIFADADPGYRDMVTAQISDGLFQNVRTRLGSPHSSILLRSEDSADQTRGDFVTLHYSTVFDKGPGNETICLHHLGGAWKLAAYNVDSPLLRSNRPPMRFQPKSTP